MLSGVFPPELLDLPRILSSNFNPLRICSKTIVQEFSKIALDLNLMYCYPLLKKDGNVCKRLDSFFPFDPISLPKSMIFFDNLLQEWDDESDSDEEEEEGEEGDLVCSLQGVSLDDYH
jgi:RNA polymerase I-specific transcription initiation factor RRN3